MFVYIVILVITGWCALYYDLAGHVKGKKIWWGIILVYLILLVGLRFEVGGDTPAYMGDYNWRVPLDEWEYNPLDPYQPGYTLLCALGKTISPDFYVFQLIHATIFNCILFYFLAKNTKYRFSALIGVFLVNYLYFATEILRETLAVMVFVLNYRSFEKKEWVKYYLGVILSMCFHISAVFLLLLPIFSKLRINKTFFIVCLVTFLGCFFMRNILNSLTTIATVGDKVSSYINETSHGLMADLLSLVRQFILPLVFCLIAKYFCKKEIKYENMIAIQCVFGIVAFFSAQIFSRAINYFILFYILSFTDFCVRYIKSNKKKYKQFAVLFTILFVFSYGSNLYMYGKYKRWIPYYSIFNPVSVNRDNYG